MFRPRFAVSALFSFGLLVFLISGCGSAPEQPKQKPEPPKPLTLVPAPAFDGQSAMAYAQTQVDFGPRVPNSMSHQLCGDFIIEELERHGCEVTVQAFDATAYDGTTLRARNIVGAINPQAKKRILLAAHWDTRPYADASTDETAMRQPIEGANDGASGVAVLLEIARVVAEAEAKPTVGVDLMFFDVEDYGAPRFLPQAQRAESYCLGSQHWAETRHKPGYHAYYGILLDMVGAKNAYFPKEGFSKERAPKVQDRVWRIAAQLGYSDYFADAEGDYITDDHIYVNEAGIPMIDIIHLSRSDTATFFPHWHTPEDTMDKLSPQTLKAVGQTLLQVLYNEK